METLKTVIVGAGISGLHSAYELAKQGQSVRVLEARERVGGRIFSVALDEPQHAKFDLGPSWFWPGQTNIETLVAELGLKDAVFTQYSQGEAIYEASGQPPQRGVQGLSMRGSYRVDGGLARITTALYDKIIEISGKQSITTNTPVTEIEREANGLIKVSYQRNEGEIEHLMCEHVIIAMPPRVALKHIDFTPQLMPSRTKELQQVATWMAGHAKATIVYKTPFWRKAGLSGDAFSQQGPLSEIHDASPNDSSVSALFGFFATPPQHRKSDWQESGKLIVTQLTRLFGGDAANPIKVIGKDWAKDNLVATDLDQHIPNHHPSNNLSTIVEPGWQQSLIWSGTETAEGHYNGYIEGAIMASKVAVSYIK